MKRIFLLSVIALNPFHTVLAGSKVKYSEASCNNFHSQTKYLESALAKDNRAVNEVKMKKQLKIARRHVVNCHAQVFLQGKQ